MVEKLKKRILSHIREAGRPIKSSELDAAFPLNSEMKIAVMMLGLDGRLVYNQEDDTWTVPTNASNKRTEGEE